MEDGGWVGVLSLRLEAQVKRDPLRQKVWG